MAEFPRMRDRLIRFRRCLEGVLVIESILLAASSLLLWFLDGSHVWLLVAVVVFVGPFVSIWSLRRYFRPGNDLLRAVKLLNSRKKLLRRRTNTPLQFSSTWFPFTAFAAKAKKGSS